MSVTFTKLKNGDWGISSTTPVHTGDEIEVTKKDGSTEIVTVSEQSTKVDNVYGERYIAAIQKKKKKGNSYCSCTDSCCSNCCYCDRTCNCRGGNIYNC